MNKHDVPAEERAKFEAQQQEAGQGLLAALASQQSTQAERTHALLSAATDTINEGAKQ